MTGMPSNAVQLAAKMATGMGLNFGNTMESPNEGDWQSSKMTLSYVKFVKSLGFNAVRIPCNWVWTHLSDQKKATIDPAWLARVKVVVGWCVANDMYVVLNDHADGGWLENNVNALKADSVNAMQKAMWEQIATTMRDFDEHLMFASTNEMASGYHRFRGDCGVMSKDGLWVGLERNDCDNYLQMEICKSSKLDVWSLFSFDIRSIDINENEKTAIFWANKNTIYIATDEYDQRNDKGLLKYYAIKFEF